MPHADLKSGMVPASVVIPVYNEAAHISDCLASIAGGSRIPQEIVVVDDGSEDDSVAVVRNWAQDSEIPLQILQNAYTKGPSGARATGAESAACDYLIFFDADVVLEDDCLASFIPWVDQGAAVCGVYSEVTRSVGAFARYKALFDHYEFSRNGVVAYNRFSGFCGGCSVRAYHESGGYRRDLCASQQYENEDFGARLDQVTAISLDPSIQVMHRYPAGIPMLRNYAKRVAGWVEVFRQHRAFETAGDATLGNAVATLLFPGALVAGVLVVAWPGFRLLALIFLGLWLAYFSSFFAYAAQRGAARAANSIVCHAVVCVAIAVGAAMGAATWLRRAQGADHD